MRAIPMLVLVAAFGVTAATLSEPASLKPAAGFVPTADVAIAIAVAVWTPIYGAEHSARERPYHAVLVDGVWEVTGSVPPKHVGGAAFARISKDDGRILYVTHWQ